jgi:hypothetical protein
VKRRYRNTVFILCHGNTPGEFLLVEEYFGSYNECGIFSIVVFIPAPLSWVFYNIKRSTP